MQTKAKKHRLFRKHRIVLWESDGKVGIAKIVDSTIKRIGLDTHLKVGEITMYRRTAIVNQKRHHKRLWLDHISTYDINDTMEVPIKLMRIPNKDDRRIYSKYRK